MNRYTALSFYQYLLNAGAYSTLELCGMPCNMQYAGCNGIMRFAALRYAICNVLDAICDGCVDNYASLKTEMNNFAWDIHRSKV